MRCLRPVRFGHILLTLCSRLAHVLLTFRLTCILSMSVNLPTATKNPAVLRKAATSNAHGKLDMMDLHTHANT